MRQPTNSNDSEELLQALTTFIWTGPRELRRQQRTPLRRGLIDELIPSQKLLPPKPLWWKVSEGHGLFTKLLKARKTTADLTQESTAFDWRAISTRSVIADTENSPSLQINSRQSVHSKKSTHSSFLRKYNFKAILCVAERHKIAESNAHWWIDLHIKSRQRIYFKRTDIVLKGVGLFLSSNESKQKNHINPQGAA